MGHDLIIVGGGPAGLSAGMYAARSGLNTLVFDGAMAGGIVAEAPSVENYPGIDSAKGIELAERLKAHATRYVEVREFEPVTDISAGQDFLVRTEKGEYRAKALVLATGTVRRKLGVKGEVEFSGKGVHHCATCDGFLFKGKRVAVLGGGNHAVEDALYLDNLGCRVTIIHRRDGLRAEEHLQLQLVGKVEVVLNSEVEEILGDRLVKKLRVRDVKEDTVKEIEVDGVFICIGEDPNNELAKKLGVSLSEGGYIETDKSQRTNVPGVYAAGDVTGGVKQLVVACAKGAISALSAFEDLRSPYWVRKA